MKYRRSSFFPTLAVVVQGNRSARHIKDGRNRSVKPAAQIRFPLRNRLAEICFSPFNIGDGISRGYHDHINGGAVSVTLSGT